MKPFAFSKLLGVSKCLLGISVLLALSFSSLANAAMPEGGQGGRDFNHVTTGYPLTGLHTTVDCASCHVGGVFKGTPRKCSSCHTKGQRIIATTMSSKHLVTAEACDICHTNTVTFFGAKFNHGKAVPGQCANCHNGVIATGRAASHTTTNKATKSCDQCHRTYAWSPASWNHYQDLTSACVTCHVSGQNQFFKTPVAGQTPEGFAHRTAYACGSCHTNYFTWGGAVYDHAGAGTVCSSCHNSTTATGTAQKAGHVATSGADCDQCHTTTRSWLPALGAAPANHSLFTVTPCTNCHVNGSRKSGAALHAFFPATCNTCHWTGASAATFSGIHKSNHKGNVNCGSGGCHSSYTSWNR